MNAARETSEGGGAGGWRGVDAGGFGRGEPGRTRRQAIRANESQRDDKDANWPGDANTH